MQKVKAVRLVILLLALGLAVWPSRCEGIDIAVSGTWTLTSGPSDLAAGAGSDLPPSSESSVDQAAITISNTAGDADNWRVDARRSDTTWNGNLVLWVKRTADGVGGGSITGGTAYQEVSTTDASFFSGSGDRNGITLQLKLSGVSIQVPPNTYSTSVVYTVVDTA